MILCLNYTQLTDVGKSCPPDRGVAGGKEIRDERSFVSDHVWGMLELSTQLVPPGPHFLQSGPPWTFFPVLRGSCLNPKSWPLEVDQKRYHRVL